MIFSRCCDTFWCRFFLQCSVSGAESTCSGLRKGKQFVRKYGKRRATQPDPCIGAQKSPLPAL